jgi:ATPase family associated with various cellular activities (AAA)/Winged helix domain, variant
MSQPELTPEPAQTLDLAEIKWLEQAVISLLLLSGVEELFDEEGEPVELVEPPAELDELRPELEKRSGDDPRTVYGLARMFDLDAVARDVLLLAFAPELEPENRMGFLAVSELMSPDGRPTVGIVTYLLAADPAERLAVRAALARQGRLRRNCLVEVIHQAGATEADAVVTIPPNVRDLLLGHGYPVPGKTMRGVAQEAPEHVPAVLGPDRDRPVPVLVVGEHTGDRRATAAALAAREEQEVLIRRIPPADARFKESAAVAELVRDARLHRAVAVAELDDIEQRFQAPLLSHVLSEGTVPLGGLVLALPHDLSGAVPEAMAGCVICEAQPVDYDALRRRWANGLAAAGLPENSANLDELAGRFRLEPWSVQAAVERAMVDSSTGELDRDALMEAARSMAGRRAVTHARRVRPRYQLSDMVLPSSVREHLSLLIGFAAERERLLYHYGYARRFTIGHGLVVLFSGESGTGKTMAGEVLANALGRDLYIVDLSQLVSKWVGETEKHIDQVFTEAEEAHGVLLFDEADALFGNRTSDVSSSNDRHANLEVGYLLQRVEAFRGVAVLTTNLSQNIDDAFKRRFHFRLDLPRPMPDLRKDLWQTMLPPGAYDETSLDLDLLAHRFDFSGGNIRNALLKATYLADQDGQLLGQRHLMEAAATESAELGRLVEWSDADK